MAEIKKDIEQNTNALSLLSLPADLLLPSKNNQEGVSLTSVVSKKDARLMMSKLSQSSAALHKLFQPALDKQGAKKLLAYVLHGDEKKVLEIAKTNPKLFFIKATAMDYAMDLEGNRRTIKNWSPYQAMFGTGDKMMLLTMKPLLDAYLSKIPNGHELAAQQEEEKFPNGFDYPPCSDEFTRLINELVAAITNDDQLKRTGKAADATLKSLMQFRQHLKPSIVESGHHFNMNDFSKTHEIYGQKQREVFQRNDPWVEGQFSFFSVNVIGFQERLLTAPYLQAACMGFHHHCPNAHMSLHRHFKMKKYVNNEKVKVTIVPFAAEDSSDRLGESVVIDSRYGILTDGLGRYFWSKEDSRYVETYVEQIKLGFQGICKSQTNRTELGFRLAQFYLS